MLELPGLFLCLRGGGGAKKVLGRGLLGGGVVTTQAHTMV